ncbi:MAG: hypothetical protein FWG49_05840 [Leptospirales bacterium]|nr:hypothetical protein [Leptospirales bacterium]
MRKYKYKELIKKEPHAEAQRTRGGVGANLSVRHNSSPKIFTLIFYIMIIMGAAACASAKTSVVSDKSAVESNKTTVESNRNSGPLFSYNSGESAKPDDTNKYKGLLVDIRTYTTNGGYYQKKYEKHLLSMAGEIVEGQDLDAAKGSIGFYYDKISASRDRLFLGLDINVEKENNLDYGRFSVNIIKENVNGIIDLMYKYNFILNEKEIAGIVIGFKWREGKNSEHVNIWMKKEDIQLFYKRGITINELYQRSVTTNSSGKVILLPI